MIVYSQHTMELSRNAFHRIRGYLKDAVLLLIILADAGFSADIYYFPRPNPASPDGNDAISVLALLNDMGLSPILPVDDKSTPDGAWCLSVDIDPEKTINKKYLIKLYKKNTTAKISLECDGVSSQNTENDLISIVKCIITTFVIKK